MMCLRLATLVHRRRTDFDVSGLSLARGPRGYTLTADAAWLAEHPLTEFNLRQESADWARVGIPLDLA